MPPPNSKKLLPRPLSILKKEPLFILAPNQAAVEYLDLLLWRSPQKSFLPHHAERKATTSNLISITDQAFNTNQATSVFNLTFDHVLITSDLKLIYELEDLSSKEAQEAFKRKFTAYHKKTLPSKAPSTRSI